MSQFSCNCRCRCAAAAIIASLVLGIIGAFLQITSVIAITPMLLWIAFGVAVVYQGVLILGSAIDHSHRDSDCKCTALNTILVGILGTILLSLVLLLIDVAATSVIGAILAGLFVFFFSLIFTATTCLIRSLFDCGS